MMKCGEGNGGCCGSRIKSPYLASGVIAPRLEILNKNERAIDADIGDKISIKKRIGNDKPKLPMCRANHAAVVLREAENYRIIKRANKCP